DGGQVVAIYVDDLLVLGSEMKRVQEVEDVLKENFEVTCFGTLRLILSIQISSFQNRVTLCQELNILEILDKYKMSACKPSPTPMDCGAKPQAARAEDEKTD
ncbi:Copia protein, partial [Gonioctena quinquepunctata]